jgi:hypothetical protein
VVAGVAGTREGDRRARAPRALTQSPVVVGVLLILPRLVRRGDERSRNRTCEIPSAGAFLVGEGQRARVRNVSGETCPAVDEVRARTPHDGKGGFAPRPNAATTA